MFVGNGSDEVLAHIFLACSAMAARSCFRTSATASSPVYCGLYDIAFETPELDEDFQIVPEDYLRPNGGIIFPNPNAPTGSALALDAIERIVAGNPTSWWWWWTRPMSTSGRSRRSP